MREDAGRDAAHGDPTGLDAVAAPVLLDAERSVGVSLAMTEWHDPGRPDVGAVLHERGVAPRDPAWEASGLVQGHDGIALHPARTDAAPGIPAVTSRQRSAEVAAAVQDLVQVALWQRGDDPTWPVCPLHPGRPLHAESPSPHEALWLCRAGAHGYPIGDLPS